MTTLEELGNAWTNPRNGETRYYINNWQDMIGMEVDYYNTGNVEHVYWAEATDRISNSRYNREIASTKVWVGEDKSIHVQYCKDKDVEEAIKTKLAERLA